MNGGELGGYSALLDEYVSECVRIFGQNLSGIYLHGSAVMGCFNPKNSDLDIIVAVKGSISDDIKRQFMEMTVAMNERAPAKGIEVSVVKAEFCGTFVYPTPFELHFSSGTLDWYRRSPDEYIAKMNGTDKDLAAHFAIIKQRGRALYGIPAREAFGEVSREDYIDSIWYDIENARYDITEDPMYYILNLSRVLAFCNEELLLSKKEGGEWGASHLPERFRELLDAAVAEYGSGNPQSYDAALAADYADYMLAKIGAFR